MAWSSSEILHATLILLEVSQIILTLIQNDKTMSHVKYLFYNISSVSMFHILLKINKSISKNVTKG